AGQPVEAQKGMAVIEAVNGNATVPKPLLVAVGKRMRAGIVVKHIDTDTRFRPFDQRIGKTLAKVVVTDDVELAEDICPGARDTIEDRGERVLAVDQKVGRVAVQK